MKMILSLLMLITLAGCNTDDPRVTAIIAGAKNACQMVLDAGPIIQVVAASDASGSIAGVDSIVSAICSQAIAKGATQALVLQGCVAQVNGVCVTGKPLGKGN